MPPRPLQPSAKTFRPVDRSVRGPTLRLIPAGFDLDDLPIHLPPQPDESTVSWMRRLAVRYDVPVRDLLHRVGARRAITSSRGVATRLRTYPGMAARLGLTPEQITALVKIQPFAKATNAYAKASGHPMPARSQSRYCPQCLAGPNPWWPDHWQSPLSWICPIHHIYLLNGCPGCGQRPLAKFGWIGRVIELHLCPSQLPTADRSGRRRLRTWCDADLTKAPTHTAPAAAVAAQQLLHDWTHGPATAAVTVAGLEVSHRIAFHALVELIDAASFGLDLLDLAVDPAEVGPGMADAAPVLTAPDLETAAGHATMLAYDGGHAPITPNRRRKVHRYSPVLAAIQLAGVRDHLAPTDQLMFRTAQRAPRYPAARNDDPAQVRRLRLPEHQPRLPEPDPAWIPQSIWPLTVPEPLLGCPDPTLRNTLLALALAKIGSPDSWVTLCRQLELPESHANRIGNYLRTAQARGTWPAIHASLDSLITLLQRKPPPVDYEHRRTIGQDIRSLTKAVEAGRRRHPTDTPTLTLTRLFWEKFTGGDIAYAPWMLRLDPITPAHVNFRRLQPIGHADLLHVAYRHLQVTHAVDGPLSWAPAALRTRKQKPAAAPVGRGAY